MEIMQVKIINLKMFDTVLGSFDVVRTFVSFFATLLKVI